MTELNGVVLYGYFRSSAAYRVRIALGLKGLNVQQISVDLPRGEHNGPKYLGINAAGLVPAWIDSDFRLAQSVAIIEYLDEVHPEPPLPPRDPATRAIRARLR